MAGNGFIPIGVEGRGWNGQLTTFWIANGYSENIFYGDPVMLDANGQIVVIGSVADVDLGNMVGVFQGCRYVNSEGTPTWNQYYPEDQAVDGIEALVAGTDPLTRYRVKFTASGVDDTELRASIGFNFDIDVTNAGSTSTGNSGLSLETAGASAATENFRLVDVVNVDGSDSPSTAVAGTTTYTHGIVIVEPLLHAYSNTTGI